MASAAPIPLYYRLENVLRHKIDGGEMPPGARFPTEAELQAEYGVARVTVRQALAALTRDGLLVRRRGAGTMVAPPPKPRRSLKLTGFIEDLIAMGLKTRVRVLDFRPLSATPAVAAALELREGAPVWLVRRLRLAGGQPFSHIVAHLPGGVGERLQRRDLASTPLLRLLETRCGLRLGSATQAIEATAADGYLADVLDVPIGAPLLSIERVVRTTSGRPVEYVRTHYRGDRYKYSVSLRRGRPGASSWSDR